MENKSYHDELKRKMDKYAHLAYRLTRKFPKEELYGIVSQLCRASLSVILNYIEGYARSRNKVHKKLLFKGFKFQALSFKLQERG